jgi:uncharacterized protein
VAETHDLIEENDVMVPMRDGVRLRADVFRPATGGPHPVLVHRYPYSTRDGFMAMFGQMIAAQGYAVVVQSCRGRYGSEGDFYPIHPDVDDSYDTVEWAAAQPWSDGNVGMYGSSYAGMTQWTAAIAGPPHLVCIAPSVATWDSTIGGWFSAPGVLTMGLAVLWSAQMTAFEAERRGVAPPLPAFAEVARLQDEGALGDPGGMAEFIALQQDAARTLFDRRPLRDIEELRELAPWFRDWCDLDDPRDPHWRTISAAAHLDEIDLPILHLTGWYDYFTKGSLDGYTTMAHYGRTEETRRNQRLVAGPWNHNTMQVRPDADPGVSLFFDFSPETPVMRFFAHHLKGELPDYGDEPPVRIYVMGENVWRDEREWPLARTQWTSWYLRGVDGERALSTEPPADEPPDTYLYDPADPVPGPMAIGPTYDDPIDLAAVATRPDVLVYTTEPLAEDTEITGPVTVELWASSSAPSTDFTAKLVEVFSDGSAIHLCQGIVRTSVGVAEPPVPGAAYRHEIDLCATSVLVKAGHRLRLDVSSSEYPTYELNPNTGRRITEDDEVVTATQHVLHDALHPSRLVLPIIPR